MCLANIVLSNLHSVDDAHAIGAKDGSVELTESAEEVSGRSPRAPSASVHSAQPERGMPHRDA